MYSPQIDEIVLLSQLENYKLHMSQIAMGFAATEPGFKVRAGVDLLKIAKEKQAAILLTEGNVAYKAHGTTLFWYEPGEVIAMQSLFNPTSNDLIEIVGELSVTVDLISVEDLKSSPEELLELMALDSKMLSLLLRGVLRKEVEFKPDMKFFAAGSIIVQGGELSNEVFTLIEGQAEALVESTKVGDIYKDEIFGMLAAITEGSRTATVRAVSDCMVMSVPAEKFIQLVETRPQLVMKLLKDLARTVEDSNKRMTEKR